LKRLREKELGRQNSEGFKEKKGLKEGTAKLNAQGGWLTGNRGEEMLTKQATRAEKRICGSFILTRKSLRGKEKRKLASAREVGATWGLFFFDGRVWGAA